MHQGQVIVAPQVLAAAIAEQFPELAGLTVSALPSSGTVIAPVRVGPHLLARIPHVPNEDDNAKVRLHDEGHHANVLRAQLPVAIPELVGIGRPFDGYSGFWSLWTWLVGESLDLVLDEGRSESPMLDQLAIDLATVLHTHHSMPASEWSGHGRGGTPLVDSDWVRRSIDHSRHLVDHSAATRVWERALTAPGHQGPPVSINGDPMPGNLLLTEGRLSGLIDIGRPVVGDPAADLQPAWEIFDEPQRSAFRAAMGLDDAAWERGRGWAFEMAIGGLHYYEHTNPVFFRLALRTLRRLIASED